MTVTGSDQPLEPESSVSNFRRHKGDRLVKLSIGEFLPSHDPLAVYVTCLMAADEDLSNIERLKDILETDRPTPETNEIGRAKWNRIDFFLFRIRLGFLSNAWKELCEKKEKNSPSLKDLVANMSKKVQDAYKEVCDMVARSPRAKNVIHAFRNQAAFHYDFQNFKKGLQLVAGDTGEIIVNHTENHLHFLVPYQVLDVIPAGRLSKEAIQQLKEEIEMIQGKLHAFIVALVDEYIFRQAEKVQPTPETLIRETESGSVGSGA